MEQPEACGYPYAGPPELRQAIDGALRRVVDPEVAMNIVDVGLVYGVAIENGVADVKVTMTSPACPVADVILQDIENELDTALPADLRIRVRLEWEPPWSSDRMSASAKAFMGW
ncbi:MAG TPA: metal-sulfur cluster assembly factor [Ramlibacter sp.]|nr:metal-sulfur cluster assembly factor [Ramlibacter sp.]